MSESVGCVACGEPVPPGNWGEGPARFFCASCREEFAELAGQAKAIRSRDEAKVMIAARGVMKLRKTPIGRGLELVGELFAGVRKKGQGGP